MTPDASESAQPLLDAAMTHHQQGDGTEARALYAQFLAQCPDHGQALRLAGALARELGELGDSRALLDRACSAAPDDAAAFNELALTCLASGELTRAEIALRDALARDGESVRAWSNLGALLQYRGHLHAAADCHREVLARQPGDLEVRCNLANTLLDAGRSEQALHECDEALSRAPGHPILLAVKGAVLVALERGADALECLRLATGRYPEDDMAWTNLGQAWRLQGDTGEATRALEQACTRNPDNARAVADLVNLYSAAGKYDLAVQRGREFLQRHRGERLVLASLAIALRDAGQADEADMLIDLDRMLCISEPELPAGFASQTAFLEELATAVLEDDSLLAEPASKSTRGGRQTGELTLSQTPALAALRGIFDQAVRDATARLRAELGPEHPILAYDSGHWLLRSWGTVLDAGGTQAPHQHPLGHLSGVYYVQLPADLSAGGRHAGWLEFGEPPARLVCRSAIKRRRVRPVPGRLVLFPSCCWHRTLPFESAETRISIAFDAVPVAVEIA